MSTVHRTFPTVKDVILFLSTLPPDAEVVFSSDSEGNSFSSLSNGVADLENNVFALYPSGTVSGERAPSAVQAVMY